MAAAEILIACLETGSEAAWTAFVQRFQPLIASSVSRVARRYGVADAALSDDLIQETYLKLCKDNCRSLRDFKAKHDEAIFGFLKVMATNTAIDHFRTRQTQKRRYEVPDDGTNHEAVTSSAGMERAVLLQEFDRSLAATECERDRKIFWLYYRQGLTAKDIAKLHPGELTESGVESCIYRLTRILRDQVNQLKKGKALPHPLGGMK